MQGLTAQSGTGRMLLGHPAALTVLFLAAMWEIFALVGMRAVLVYYLVGQLSFSEPSAVQVYGFSTSAGFFTALIGGLIADRYLGAWRAALIGALFMGSGFFLLSVESLLYPGLVVIAIGNGLFKPTMLAQVGLLYATEDPRRDRAYNVYSVGCNLGATVSPLVCGALGAVYGWRYAFIACGIGMAISVAILIAGRKLLPTQQTVSGDAARSKGLAMEGASLAILGVAWLAAVLFFAAYGQIGGTIALWTQSDVDRVIQVAGSSFSIPAAWFQSLNPLLIFVLVPFVNALWARDRTPVSPVRDLGRMAMGGIHMAACFCILASVAALRGEGGGANPLWVVLAIVPFTLGELYLNTTGQSMFSRLAPRGWVSVFIGIWILTLMLGHALAGWLGRVWKVLAPVEFFGLMVLIALAGALVMITARTLLTRRESSLATASRY